LLCLRDFAAHQVLERESQPQELADVSSAGGDAGLNGFLCLVAVEEVVIAPQDQLHGVGTRLQCRVRCGCHGAEVPQKLLALPHVAVLPEPAEIGCHFEGGSRVFLCPVGECGADVVDLASEPREPSPLVGVAPVRLGLVGEAGEVIEMSRGRGIRLAALS